MTSGQDGQGASPSLTAESLVSAIPRIGEIAKIDSRTLLTVPSASLTLAHLLQLEEDLAEACRHDSTGAVVVQGTDTLEESAYLLDLVWQRPEPVVVTGAMRTADALGADGPANLAAAVTVAASPDARERGCLVVMNDEIHRARSVRKQHTANVNAFQSPGRGPIGVIHEGRAIFYEPVDQSRRPVAFDRSAPSPDVALLRLAMGADARLLDAACSSYDGVVVEALGGGHVPEWWVEPLLKAAERIPVVLASRTGSGSVLESTYGFPGSERDVLRGGVISAGSLDGLKARILLTLLLHDTKDLALIRYEFAERAYFAASNGG
jgi:L-asparaginase